MFFYIFVILVFIGIFIIIWDWECYHNCKLRNWEHLPPLPSLVPSDSFPPIYTLPAQHTFNMTRILSTILPCGKFKVSLTPHVEV